MEPEQQAPSVITWASALSGGDRDALARLLAAVADLTARVEALEAAAPAAPPATTTSTRRS